MGEAGEVGLVVGAGGRGRLEVGGGVDKGLAAVVEGGVGDELGRAAEAQAGDEVGEGAVDRKGGGGGDDGGAVTGGAVDEPVDFERGGVGGQGAVASTLGEVDPGGVVEAEDAIGVGGEFVDTARNPGAGVLVLD